MGQFDEFNIIPKRFIDLRNSTLDEKKSDPKNHVYEFTNKVYYDKTDNKPPFGYLKWARKTQHLQSAGILSKLKRWGYFPVDIEEHQILPEPFDKSNIDENGHIVYVDALLCAIPYEKLAKKRWREISKSNTDLKSRFAQFDDAMKEAGAELGGEQREHFEEQRRKVLGF